jgi:hypothetical protein
MDRYEAYPEECIQYFLQLCSFALRENTSHRLAEPSVKEYQAIQQIVERIEGISIINEAVTKICGVTTCGRASLQPHRS